MDQEQMIMDLLKEYHMENVHAIRLPISQDYDIAEGGKLLPEKSNEEQAFSVKHFQSLVGSLLWIARCTRPDIIFAVHACNRKTHAPDERDLKMAFKILSYLKGSKDAKLEFNGWDSTSNKMVISGYSDADWGDDRMDRKSVSGGLICLNGMPVSWICKKQSCVAMSTLEAEHAAAAEVVRELIGLKQIMEELNLKFQMPITLWIDNKEAINQVEQESSSKRLKHADMKLKFLCDRASKEEIIPLYVKSEDQVADLLTKPLSQQRILKLKKLIGLHG
jgi:hypothetical protein